MTGTEINNNPSGPDPGPVDAIFEPRLSGVMINSMEYTNMGMGFTDSLLLVGHADGLILNTPTQVFSVKEIIMQMGNSSECPLIRALVEAYYAGSRDVWVMSAAPMSEYARPDDRDETYYSTYKARLDTAYNVLDGFSDFRMIVPVGASLYGTEEDFLLPLIRSCRRNFEKTGSIRLGLIGSDHVPITPDEVDAVTGDERLAFLSNRLDQDSPLWDDYSESGAHDGKFVMPIIGRGIFNMTEMPTNYVDQPVSSIAGKLSNQFWDKGMTYETVPNMPDLSHRDFTKEQVKLLARAKLNPLIRPTRSKRGITREVCLASDNMLGQDGSDYWALPQVRLIMNVNHLIREIADEYIGTTLGLEQLRADILILLGTLVKDNIIRHFELDVNRIGPTQDNNWTEGAEIGVLLQPFFGLREIYFTSSIGPSA